MNVSIWRVLPVKYTVKVNPSTNKVVWNICLGHVIVIHATVNESIFLGTEIGATWDGFLYMRSISILHLLVSDAQTTEVNAYFCTKVNMFYLRGSLTPKSTRYISIQRVTSYLKGKGNVQLCHTTAGHWSPGQVKCCARVFELHHFKKII